MSSFSASPRNPRSILACQGVVRGESYLRPGFVSLVTLAQLRRGSLRSRLRLGRRLVGVPGIEPGTSALSGLRSNRLSYTPKINGGASNSPLGLPRRSSRRIMPSARLRFARYSHSASPRQSSFSASPRTKTGGGNRVRTGDLMLAKHVLYQLSYAPSIQATVWPQIFGIV